MGVTAAQLWGAEESRRRAGPHPCECSAGAQGPAPGGSRAAAAVLNFLMNFSMNLCHVNEVDG